MRSQTRSRSLFFAESLHPGVLALYVVGVLCFCMLAFQPIYLLLTLAAGIALNIRLRGGYAALRSLRWQIPLLLLVALFNPIISPIGSTMLVRIAGRTLYAESLLYGVFMGVMLVSMFTWFSNAAAVFSTVHGAFRFYPAVTNLVLDASYLAYALFVFLPLLADAVEELRWKR